jgi:hypothetical protein
MTSVFRPAGVPPGSFADRAPNPGRLGSLLQGLPERVGKEAHQEVRLDAILALILHGADRQLVFSRSGTLPAGTLPASVN